MVINTPFLFVTTVFEIRETFAYIWIVSTIKRNEKTIAPALNIFWNVKKLIRMSIDL